MESKNSKSILKNWLNEFSVAITKKNFLYVALFSANKELIYANNAMISHFKGLPHESFINPTFDKILAMDYSIPLIFEGFLTLGDNDSVNISILAQIYRKDDQLLIVGGISSTELLQQNASMHELNRQNSNLQRQLIKEKFSLELTLQKLNEANNELIKLNTDKDRFISILAHDLKNPFNALLGLSEFLSENIETLSQEEIEEQVTAIHSSLNKTYGLLDDILLWARSQGGKMPFEPITLNLNSTYTNIIEALQSQSYAKNILITNSSSENLNIMADQDMLKTILRNLITNAIKFTRQGGQINIFTEKQGTNAIITIADNGIGMNKAQVSELFDITKTQSSKGTEGEQGTGFGLLLCKEFIERNKGKIWVESELEKGSKFIFSMPISDPDDLPIELYEKDNSHM